MSSTGFRSEKRLQPLAECNLGLSVENSNSPSDINCDVSSNSSQSPISEVIIGQDLPLFYSMDYETKMLSDAGILDEVEDMYNHTHSNSNGQQLGFDNVNSPSASDILQLEDWQLPDGNFSLDSALYHDLPVMAESPSPASDHTQHASFNPSIVRPKVEPCSFQPSIVRPKVEPSSSFEYPSYQHEYPISPAPSASEFEEKPLVAKHRKLAKERAAEDRCSVGPIRRRGRPVKATSNSKQAMYAREYRNKNKQLLEEYRLQVETLVERNRMLEENHARMADNYNRLTEEFEQVQEVNQKLQSEIVPVVSQILQNGAQADKIPLKSGVCIHLSNRGISLKSCDHSRKLKKAACRYLDLEFERELLKEIRQVKALEAQTTALEEANREMELQLSSMDRKLRSMKDQHAVISVVTSLVLHQHISTDTEFEFEFEQIL